MNSRRPRRRRRERASTLPRPGSSPPPTVATVDSSGTPQEHHVSTNYGYVRRDLGAVCVVGVVTLVFVLVAAFIA